MARQFVSVTKGSKTLMVDAPSFTQEDFHGFKKDSRNKIPNTHTIDKKIVQACQLLQNWANTNYPDRNVKITITSTARTPEFQLLLKEGGSTKAGVGGPHVLRIAIDFNFISNGSVAIDIHTKYNTIVRDKGNLYNQLRQIGVAGIGLYGKKKGYFCHLDTRSSDTKLPRSNSDSVNGPYQLWKIANPPFEDSPIQEDDTNYSAELTPPEESFCTQEYVCSLGLSTGYVITFKELISQPSCPFANTITASDLYDYEFDGISNRRRLYDALSEDTRFEYSQYEDDASYNEAVDYPLEVGATYRVPCEWIITTQEKGSENQLQADENDPAYLKSNRGITGIDKIGATLTSSLTNISLPYPPIFTAITKDPGYKRTIVKKMVHQSYQPQCTVYGWSRALNTVGAYPILNLTRDIISITTTSELSSGGSFNIELAPIVGDFNGQNWIKKGVYSNNENQVSLTPMIRPYAAFIQHTDSVDQPTEDTHSDMYYEKIFFQNDPIFIKFEQLDIDRNYDDYIIKLSDQWYDMMGLIDSISLTMNASGSIMSVNISGRDFQKPLIDESGYYNPYSVGKLGSYFGQYADLVAPRSFDGGIYKYRTVDYLTLANSMEFALYGLISNEFVPSACFNDNWSFDDLNHLYVDYNRKNKKGSQNETNGEKSNGFGLEGIWKKIKLWIDPQVADYIIYDDSISLPEGSILQYYFGD